MKIALLTPTFSEFSGIDRVVALDSEEYINQGNEVTIFTLKADMKPKRAKLIEMGMPKNSVLERLYRLFFFLDIFKIKKYSKMLKDYDRIIAYFYPLTWLAYKAKKKYNIKYTYWNAGVAYPRLFKKLGEKIYLKLFLHYVKKSISNADGAISISKFMQKELKRETGLDSIVKYIDIDKIRFHQGINGDAVRKKYNLGNSPMCLYVGRISPHKGIHLLIKAFNLVLKGVPDAKLLIVGKKTFGKYAKELEKLAEKINRDAIIFTDFVPDKELPGFYAASEVYTTATLWEGFDMPAVEAQECGKKVVAFDLCSHPEVVKNGVLIEPKNINKFAEAVINIIKKNGT
ncbi:glycosyltransferase family 4 protein [Candidatus Woesearchaeota archaeon]|nr:glycosyltransferase family 4 protein [Candidatus Woesearchaeota archaeon]